MVITKLSLDQHLRLAALRSLLTSPHGLELLGNIARLLSWFQLG